MENMMQFMRRPRRFASESVCFKIASIVCYSSGLFVFIVAILKMTTFGLSETQLFFGVLLILCVMVQMMSLGMMWEVYRWLKTNQEKL